MTTSKKIAFLGAGAMATALAKGLLKKNYPKDKISAFDISKVTFAKFAEITGIRESETPEEAIRDADIVILAVKPQNMEAATYRLKGLLADKLIISIAAGIKISSIKEMTDSKRAVRVMPNTPALIGEGISVITSSYETEQEDIECVENIFKAVGETCKIEEKLMDAVTGLSGSGPAYVFDFIQALADAGVNCGLTREIAMKLVTRTVYGSAKMLIETGEHPSVLKDKVTSPGGTTAKGLAVLEKHAFKGIISDAVLAAVERSKELGRE